MACEKCWADASARAFHMGGSVSDIREPMRVHAVNGTGDITLNRSLWVLASKLAEIDSLSCK